MDARTPAGVEAAREAPSWVGRYRLLRRLGLGRAPDLYLAVAGGAELAEACALRLLPPLRSVDELVRLGARARAAIGQGHPALARVLDVGLAGDRPFVVSELVDGRDLRAILDRCARRGTTTPEDVATAIVRDVCRALEHLHGRAVPLAHRDVRPERVLIAHSGVVKLADLDFTTAPAGGDGARGDVVAAGLMLFELLTGRTADGPADTEPPRIGGPPGARALLDGGTGRADARELGEALERFAGPGPSAPRVAAWVCEVFGEAPAVARAEPAGPGRASLPARLAPLLARAAQTTSWSLARRWNASQSRGGVLRRLLAAALLVAAAWTTATLRTGAIREAATSRVTVERVWRVK